MGAVFSTTALVLALVVGDDTAADVVLALLVVAAGLESIFGYCLGCKVFGAADARRVDSGERVRGVRGHQRAAVDRALTPALSSHPLAHPCRQTRRVIRGGPA